MCIEGVLNGCVERVYERSSIQGCIRQYLFDSVCDDIVCDMTWVVLIGRIVRCVKRVCQKGV